MGKVIVNITMSLDGFIAGPDISMEHPMGKGGERLHSWMFEGKTDAGANLLEQVVETSGAVIAGGHTFKIGIHNDKAWGDSSPFKVPAFVLVHTVPEIVVDGFTYVTDGIESALAQAKSAAGDKNVWIMGGANIIQQYLRAGLVDELQIHIAPVLMGAGTRLFDDSGMKPVELESIEVISTPGATHLQYRVVKETSS